jgi:hypothetical protein
LLRYFRINDPYRLLGLLILLLIIYLPLFIDPPSISDSELKSMLVGERIHDGHEMYTEVADNTAPLAAWFHALIDMVFGRSLLARHILAFLIIFFQSAYLGIIFITKKAFNENTFIPSLIFSLLFFFSYDTLTLSDELLGSGFLLLALNNLFKEIEFRVPRDETTFNLGIYISLASLFYFPYVIFLFAILVGLFLFARANARKYLLFVFGFLLPHFFVLCISYLNDSLPKIWNYYYLNNLAFGAEFIVPVKGLFILGIIPLFYLLVSIVMLNRLARFSKYQSQTLQSIFIWIGFCFIYFLFCREVRPQTFIVLIPPVTFLLTHFLLLIRRKKYAEMNTLIILIGIVTITYLSRYNKLPAVNYQKLIVSNAGADIPIQKRKVLVLGDSRFYYLSNQTATPYIDWNLAKETFEHPEFYESVTDVYRSFQEDAPDVVIDEGNLLKPFLDRIPEIKRQYHKEGMTYVRNQTSK